MADEVEDETTIGTWIGQGESEFVNEFDAYFQKHGKWGTYSRSERVKMAMKVYMRLHDAMRTHPEVAKHPDDYQEIELLHSIDARFGNG